MKHLQKYKNFYESINSPLLDLSDNVDSDLISKIKSSIKPNSSILEISCGNAADSLELQKLGFVVTCTDSNSEYVQNAKNLGLNCIQHDTKNKFPFSDNQFDLIYSRLGLHYFTEQELLDIFSELKRIGRKILMTVKIVDDIKTGKVILSSDKWEEIVGKYFDIESFEIKEGLLYGNKSKWIEIFGNTIKEPVNISESFSSDDIEIALEDLSDLCNLECEIEQVYFNSAGVNGYQIWISSENDKSFKINNLSESVIKKFDELFKNDFRIVYEYRGFMDWYFQSFRILDTGLRSSKGNLYNPEGVSPYIVMIKIMMVPKKINQNESLKNI